MKSVCCKKNYTFAASLPPPSLWCNQDDDDFCYYLHRQLPILSAKITTTALMNGLLQLFLWKILPSFICDIAFYWMLFLAPYSAWHCFKAQLAEGQHDNNPARDFLLWLWRKAKIKFQHFRTQRLF